MSWRIIIVSCNLIHFNIQHLIIEGRSLSMYSSNYGSSEYIVGFVTDLSGEKRGPMKNYRRFNFVTTTDQNMSGWIFASVRIEETESGKNLIHSYQAKKAIRINGKITNES